MRTPHHPLIALLTVNAIACVGTRVSAIAIPWFVLVTTGSATRTGLVAAFELGPYVLVKAAAGPLTDRIGQRRVSIVADLGSMVVIGLIPVAHLADVLSLPLLLGLVAVGGALRGPGDNAKHTSIPFVAEQVGASLERVTGLYGAIERGSGLVAPAVAAVMIQAFSPPAAIAVTAGCFGLSAVVMGVGIPRIPPADVAGPEDESAGYVSRLRAGWRFLVGDRLLLSLVSMIAVTNLLDVAKTTVLLPVWARAGGHGVTSISLFLTCMAASSTVSSVIASRYGERLPRRLVYFGAFAIAGPPPFLALALDLPVGAIAGVYVVAGFASGFLNPMLGALFYERIPRPLLGRVGALADATSWAGMPFGGLVGAALIAGFGLSPTFVIVAVAYGLSTLVPAIGTHGRSFDRPELSEAEHHMWCSASDNSAGTGTGVTGPVRSDGSASRSPRPAADA